MITVVDTIEEEMTSLKFFKRKKVFTFYLKPVLTNMIESKLDKSIWYHSFSLGFV